MTMKIDGAASTGNHGTYSDIFPWPLSIFYVRFFV